MRAGRMDRRITVLRKVATQNAYGEEIITWSTLATVWAEVRAATSRESYAENQFQGVADTLMRIRWSELLKSITIIDRITFDGRTFDITGVREIGRREGLDIDCYARAETAVAEPIVASGNVTTYSASMYWWLPTWSRTPSG